MRVSCLGKGHDEPASKGREKKKKRSGKMGEEERRRKEARGANMDAGTGVGQKKDPAVSRCQEAGH